jgi:hypothetical protein
MPVTELENQGGIGSILGLVGGYLAGNPARKAAKEQQDYTRKRQSAEDDRAQKQLASNIQEETDRHKGFEDQQSLAQRETAANATIHQTLGPEPKYDPNNPGPYLAYATKAASYFRNQGLAQTPTGKGWQDEANKIPQGYQQFTGGQKNVASAGLDKARTQQIVQWKQIADYKFAQKMKELQTTEQGRERAKAANQAAAYARAQLSQGGANARAQMSEDERTMIAEMTALNAANGADANRAYQTARTQYEGQLRQWTTDQATGNEQTARGNAPPADYGQPAPTFNFSMPSSQPSAPTIILVPGPNGQPIPVVTRQSATPPKPKPKPKAPDAPAAAPAAAPSGGGGIDLGTIVHGIQHLFGGGNAAPTPAKTVVGSDGHTYQQLPNGKWKVIK